MKTISIGKLLEDEAKECDKSAQTAGSPHAEVFHVLAISYRSLVKRMRDQAMYKEDYARKDS